MTDTAMLRFVTSIKKKYQERRINREKQWPPCHGERLICLELVEGKKGEGYYAGQQRGQRSRTLPKVPVVIWCGQSIPVQLEVPEERGYDRQEGKAVKQTPLAYSDLFNVQSGTGKCVRRVLIEGDAGIGKTTLCTALSEDWANEKLFQQFELLLLLPLRKKEVGSAGSLPKLLELFHLSSDLQASVATFFENGEGEKVLIIADGWDELNVSDRKEGSFLYELLLGNRYTFLSVLLTSRPSSSASLHDIPCIDQFIEIHGFNEENIKKYIQSEFASDQEKAEHLLKQLESNPLVKNVCSVPLNCAIVCHLWHTLEEALPSTMTDLYTKMMLNIILRNIKKWFPEYEGIKSLPGFNSLPEPLLPSWWHLCEFAFQTLASDRLIFSQEQLSDFFPKDSAFDPKILGFGLLQQSDSILDVGLGFSFHFLHFTFQEFLAALHLSRQTSDIQLTVSQTAATLPLLNPHGMIWQFFFGISFRKSVSSYDSYLAVVDNLCEVVNINRHIFIAKLAFEASDDEVSSYVAELYMKHHMYTCHGHIHNAYNYVAVLHVIAHSQGCINVSFSNSSFSDKQVTALADVLASKNGKLQVKLLDLHDNKLTSKGASELIHRASAAFCILESLNLVNNRIGAQGTDQSQPNSIPIFQSLVQWHQHMLVQYPKLRVMHSLPSLKLYQLIVPI